MENTDKRLSEDGLLSSKMVHLALPVRWSLIGPQGRGPVEIACTYDVHLQGARLLGGHGLHPGDRVMMERGRSKAICQVTWVADPDSSLRGQFSVRCLEGKVPWDEEVRQMEEQFHPASFDGLNRPTVGKFGISETNRRRRPRFCVHGQAEVIGSVQRVGGAVQEISECGARIKAAEILRPGAVFRLTLNILDVNLSVKAEMKYMVDNLGIGVEFQEIRRGDRPLLNYVLAQLRANRVEDFVEVEVVPEPLAAAAG
jgi:hypothetical protein